MIIDFTVSRNYARDEGTKAACNSVDFELETISFIVKILRIAMDMQVLDSHYS